MHSQNILIIGEVFLDVHTDFVDETKGYPPARLGGIFHSARACDALGVTYSLAYCASSYLDSKIEEWASSLHAQGCMKFAEVAHSPSVMLISESQEIRNQGYYNVLSGQAEIEAIRSIGDIVSLVKPTDVMIFPGRFSLAETLQALSDFDGKIHVDCAYDSDNIVSQIDYEIESIILSTSSNLFRNECFSMFDGVLKYFANLDIVQFLLKENRGGAVAYRAADKVMSRSASHNYRTVHSVGVGDVYDVFFIYDGMTEVSDRMRLAAYCSALYAQTMSYREFKEEVELVMRAPEVYLQLQGTFLPWETRKKQNIYLAGPDFPEIDTRYLDWLYESLLYHNFSPRLPIRENGLASADPGDLENMDLYALDYALLQQCSLLIATLLTSDPGTFAEIGIFKQMGKPIIIFDPYGLCGNMFVRESATEICTDLDSVINAVFDILGERC